MVAGFAIGGAIYAFAPKDSSREDDPALTEYYDKGDQAAQRMLGNQGPLMVSLFESLKHVRTYAVIVIVASVLGSFGCFYLARNAYDGTRS